MTGAAIRIGGLDAALAKLDGIAARARHPRGMWENIGGHLVSATAQRFITERGPGGNPWPQSLRALAEGGQTLTDKGWLRQSFTFDATDTGVETGTSVPYAAIHQFGGTIRARTKKGLRFGIRRAGANAEDVVVVQSVTIPARPFLGLDDGDTAAILGIAADWLLPGGGDAR